MRRVIITAVAASLIAGVGAAQSRPARGEARGRLGPPPGAAIERLNGMTPQQRQRALDRLPPDRRAQVEKRLERYNALPADVKERLREQYTEFQKLPSEKQQAI